MTARVELYKERQALVDIGPHADRTIRYTPPKWRWRFVKNGRILADSGQGYSRRIDCLNGCATVLGGVFQLHALEVLPPGLCGWLHRYLPPSEAFPPMVVSEVEAIPVHDLTRQP